MLLDESRRRGGRFRRLPSFYINIFFFVDRFAFFILRDTVISGIEAFGFFSIKNKKETVYNIIYSIHHTVRALCAPSPLCNVIRVPMYRVVLF
jgi:hypothetical protein